MIRLICVPAAAGVPFRSALLAQRAAQKRQNGYILFAARRFFDFDQSLQVENAYPYIPADRHFGAVRQEIFVTAAAGNRA